MFSSPTYWLVAVPVLGLLLAHWWLSRRKSQWLGVIVPALVSTGAAYLVLTRDDFGARDYVALAVAIGVLLWMWAQGGAARRERSATTS